MIIVYQYNDFKLVDQVDMKKTKTNGERVICANKQHS